MIEAGAMAPDFELPDATNDKVKLSEMRGKTVVLFFFPRADTPG